MQELEKQRQMNKMGGKVFKLAEANNRKIETDGRATVGEEGGMERGEGKNQIWRGDVYCKTEKKGKCVIRLGPKITGLHE